MQAQRDYYKLPSADAVFRARVDAIADALPSCSTLLDIGCNDGSIARELLALGKTDRIFGLDLENIIEIEEPRIKFIQGDILNFDLRTLPPADGVLILNVLHHVIARDVERAKHIMSYLLNNYNFVFVDLGSKTEVGDWGWRRRYEELYDGDTQIWREMFADAVWRFKILKYSAQGGERVLWKLYKKQYELSDVTIESDLVRPIGSWPGAKCLIDKKSNGDRGTVSEDVSFQVLRSSLNDRFFRKIYAPHVNPYFAECEYNIGRHASEALRIMQALGVPGMSKMRVVEAIELGAANDLTFLYEPDLYFAKPVHHQDWQIFHSAEDARSAFVMSCAMIETGWCPPCQLICLADFQCATGWDGLAVLDFEPSSPYAELRRLIAQVETT